MPDLSVSDGGVIPPVSSSGAVVGICSSEVQMESVLLVELYHQLVLLGVVVGICSSEGPDGVCSSGVSSESVLLKVQMESVLLVELYHQLVLLEL